MHQWVRVNCLIWALALVLLPLGEPLSPFLGAGAPAEAQRPDRESQPLGQFLTVTSPVDDAVFGRVQNAALNLHDRAGRENRRAVLVLEITPGSSPFHEVYGLAQFLTSAQVARVTTVAWIPETVTGHNVILALACDEIIMHPDAELGDIGRGQALDAEQQQDVLSIVNKRHNPKLSAGLARGLMDPQVSVLKAQVRPPDADVAETRVLTSAELEQLRQTRAAILDVQTVKEAGVTGTFSGTQARSLDILAAQTAGSRPEVAEIYDLPAEAMREGADSGEALNVRLIKIDGMIEPVLESFVERQIDRSVNAGADLLIFRITSPGGYLISSQNLAYKIADLDPKKVRTVAYIPEKALSGAAIIAMGCDEIYMAPDATIGDAAPIEVKQGGQFERAPEKILSPLRKSLRELAEKNNRPPALAEAMADQGLKVYRVTNNQTGRVWYMSEYGLSEAGDEWSKGPLVAESREGNLLTVDGQRAHELKLAQRPVQDMAELKQRLGIPANRELVAVGRTWVDTLVFVLNTQVAMFLLLVVGIICIYLELHLMTGLLGIISALCFSLFFWSRFLGGTAGWLEVVLFILGLACLALEILVIPGFGVFGVSGGLLMLAALIMASQTFGDWGPESDFERMAESLATVALSIVTVAAAALILSRFLPHIPLLNRMILSPPAPDGSFPATEPQLRPELTGQGGAWAEPAASLVGQRGETLSVLRPAGKARIGRQLMDVVSDGPYIAKGSPVEVVQVSGNRVVVREV